MVLLIDEIDRADEALEAVLLELLGEYQVSVPEIGTFTAKHAPYVVLTSNNTRDLAAALEAPLPASVPRLPVGGARTGDRAVQGHRTHRCPGRATRRRGARAARARSAQGAEHLRDHRLGTHPGGARGRANCRAKVLSDTVSVVVKYDKDVRKSLDALPRLVDPNAKVPASLPRSRPRSRPRPQPRPRRHDHDHRPDGQTTANDSARSGGEGSPRTPDGKAVRQAKDKPGRFKDGYYGQRPARPPRWAAAGRSRRRADGSDPAPLRPAPASRRAARLDPRGARRDAVRRAARCPRRPGLSCGPHCGWRWSRTSATSRCSTRSSTRSSRWCGSATDGRRARPQPRPRRPRRHRRTGVVHVVRGAQRRRRRRATSTASPPSIRDYFKQEDLAQQYNLHQEANKIDLAALTDQIVLLQGERGTADENKYRVELSADRLHGAGAPGQLRQSTGHQRRRDADDRRTGRAAGLAQRPRGRWSRGRRDRTPRRCAGG